MALCSEACVSGSGSGGDSSGSEMGSTCLRFGVRSYLHHFYEDCSSSSMWDRHDEDQDYSQTPPQWSSVTWKVTLVMGMLVLTAGAATLSVGLSTPHRIESFGEEDLLFVDSQAISFNKGLHLSVVAGIGLSCLGCGLALVGVVLWLLPGTNSNRRLLHMEEERERRGKWETKGVGGVRGEAEVVTKAPGGDEGKVPIILSKVKSIQPVP